MTATEPVTAEDLRRQVLAAALDYAAEGQPVFPCYPATPTGWSEEAAKHPVGGLHWRQRATTDADQIARWWAAHPHAIGLPTGLRYDVLDVDRKPGRPNGYAVLGFLDGLGMLAGAVRWVTTPSGGCHVWFPAGGSMPNATFARAGVDLRGLGGYVIAPPSYVETEHYAGRYVVSGEALPPAAGAPFDWQRMALLLAGRRPLRAAGPPGARRPVTGSGSPGLLDALVTEMAEVEPGGRNDALFHKARVALERGLDPAVLVEAAVGAGLDRAECETTVASAARWVARKSDSGGAER